MRQTDAYLPTDTHCAPMHSDYLLILTVHRCAVITYRYSLCNAVSIGRQSLRIGAQWVPNDTHCAPMRTRNDMRMRTDAYACTGAPMRAVHRCALRTDACCAPMRAAHRFRIGCTQPVDVDSIAGRINCVI